MKVDNVLDMNTREFVEYIESKPMKSVRQLRTDMKNMSRKSNRVCRRYE